MNANGLPVISPSLPFSVAHRIFTISSESHRVRRIFLCTRKGYHISAAAAGFRPEAALEEGRSRPNVASQSKKEIESILSDLNETLRGCEVFSKCHFSRGVSRVGQNAEGLNQQALGA
jgi:hypothetical protein